MERVQTDIFVLSLFVPGGRSRTFHIYYPLMKRALCNSWAVSSISAVYARHAPFPLHMAAAAAAHISVILQTDESICPMRRSTSPPPPGFEIHVILSNHSPEFISRGTKLIQLGQKASCSIWTFNKDPAMTSDPEQRHHEAFWGHESSNTQKDVQTSPLLKSYKSPSSCSKIVYFFSGRRHETRWIRHIWSVILECSWNKTSKRHIYWTYLLWKSYKQRSYVFC